MYGEMALGGVYWGSFVTGVKFSNCKQLINILAILIAFPKPETCHYT